MAIFDSKLEQSVEFTAEPVVVAQACQDAILSIGLKIKEVSRQTGIISARTPVFGLGGDKFLTLKVAKSDKGTKVDCTASAMAGVFSTSAVQKLLADFIQTLSKHSTLKDSSTAGW